MDEAIKQLLINRLGMLQLANVELSAQSARLQGLARQQAERIKQLESEVHPAPANGHDSNPYAEQSTAAH